MTLFCFLSCSLSSEGSFFILFCCFCFYNSLFVFLFYTYLFLIRNSCSQFFYDPKHPWKCGLSYSCFAYGVPFLSFLCPIFPSPFFLHSSLLPSLLVCFCPFYVLSSLIPSSSHSSFLSSFILLHFTFSSSPSYLLPFFPSLKFLFITPSFPSIFSFFSPSQFI